MKFKELCPVLRRVCDDIDALDTTLASRLFSFEVTKWQGLATTDNLEAITELDGFLLFLRMAEVDARCFLSGFARFFCYVPVNLACFTRLY